MFSRSGLAKIVDHRLQTLKRPWRIRPQVSIQYDLGSRLPRVAIFADTSGYGESGLQDVIKALEAKKLTPVHVARFELGVKDLTAELKAAQAVGANVIFSYTVGQENAVIALGRQALGWKVTQVGPWSLSLPFFLDGAREAADGSLMAQTFIAEPSNERRRAFLSAYAGKYKTNKISVPMADAQPMTRFTCSPTPF